ncbi:hypothetical protein R80B4_00959 [Fibrobacteres bacterium R8-0-B4]
MRDFFRELLLIISFVSVVTGIALIYHPAAFIIGGALMMWLCAPAKTGIDKKGTGKR